MIVFYHLRLQLNRVGYDGYWPVWLSAGVDIFFVISGFIMWITTSNGMSTLEFFRRRFLRIVPLYWILTSFVLVTLISAPNAVQSGQLNEWHILGSYLFIPVVHPVLGDMKPLLIPGWTLNYEMFFYLIFGLALVLPATVRLVAVSIILIALSSVSLVINLPPLSIVEFYTFSRILEFAFGMALGWVYTKGGALPPAMSWACLILGFVGIVLMADSNEDRGLRVGIPALLVVAGSVFLERRHGAVNIRGLHFLGNASYSLYLSHPIVLSAVGQIWRKLPVGRSPGGTLVLAFAAIVSAVVVAALIYNYLEVPLLRLGRLQIFRASPFKQGQSARP